MEEIMNANFIDKSQGYVLMWRSIMSTPLWQNEKLSRVYHWVMYRANYEGKEVFPTKNKVKLKKGQFITSLPHAAKELGMGQATADSYLNVLKSERIIDRHATNKYTVITVQSWDELQNPDRKTDSKWRADGEQMDTDNTYNTLNTYRDTGITSKHKNISYLENIPLENITQFTKRFNITAPQVKSKAEDLLNYCKAKGKKYSDYKAFLRNAIKKDFGEKLEDVSSLGYKKYEKSN